MTFNHPTQRIKMLATVVRTPKQKVEAIFNFIRNEGNQISFAACYNSENDAWQVGNLVAILQNRTFVVCSRISNLKFVLTQTSWDSNTGQRTLANVRYELGDENDLDELYEAIFGE
jgi:hypothetical protein